MIKETLRSLAEPERRCLQEQIAVLCPVNDHGTAKWTLIWSGGLLLLALLAAGLIVLRPNPVLGGVGGGILSVAGIICLYGLSAVISSFFRWRRVYRVFSTDTQPVIRRLLEENRVLSKDITASEVYEIPESEDEGPGYIFAIGDGKSLLLKGQRYAPEEDQMPWPARDFSLVRSADGAHWIGLFSRGETLQPSRTINMRECTNEFVWSEREDVLVGPLALVLKGIMQSGPDAEAHSTRLS